MKWRKWNNIIHRDLGYLCFGLTLIYAISGIAVNHIRDWNPSYVIERSQVEVGSLASFGQDRKGMLKEVLNRLGEKGAYKSAVMSDPETMKIFVEGNNISVHIPSGRVSQEKVRDRPFFREINFLHLNHAKKLWTWFADLYAACLIFLAITGLFVLKGKKGLKGRGKWLASAGILAPLLFLWAFM